MRNNNLGSPYSATMGASDGLGSSWNQNDRTALGFGLGGLLGGLFGNESAPNPNDYLSKIPGQISPYLNPYMHAGAGMLPGLEQQYGELTSHPGQMLNQIGKGFHQSPGFNFAMQQAMQGAGHSAAAGGMAGSPEAQQLAEQKATGLANQDYYNWLNQATGMYGQGLHGMQGLAGMGEQAGMGMAEAIAQALSAQAQAAQEQQAARTQEGGGIGGFLGGLLGHFI